MERTLLVVGALLVISTFEVTLAREVAQDPLMHYATDTEVVIRKDDGSYKMAYDTADGFRAEMRDAGGVVKGVYGFTGPDGKIITKTYLSDKKGYRLASFSELGVELPALPYNLHPRAGQRKFPKEETSKKEEEPIMSRQEIEEPIVYKHPVQIHPFGRFDHSASAIVIEPAREGLVGPFIEQRSNEEDFSDFVLVGEDTGGPFGALSGRPAEHPVYTHEEDFSDVVLIGEDTGGPFGALSGRPAEHPVDTEPAVQEIAGFPFPVKPGQAVSHINPSATAIAGAGGMAQARPGGTAIVGAGGIAWSSPTGNAVVGPGGVAISAPVSTSQAGVGGIAIAGGQAIAIAGIQNPGQQFIGGSGPVLPQEQDDSIRPGFLALRSSDQKQWYFNPKSYPAPTLPIEIKASEGSQITTHPIIANYFFNVPQHFFDQAASSEVAKKLRTGEIPTPEHSQVVYMPWYVNKN